MVEKVFMNDLAMQPASFLSGIHKIIQACGRYIEKQTLLVDVLKGLIQFLVTRIKCSFIVGKLWKNTVWKNFALTDYVQSASDVMMTTSS